MPAPT